MENLIEKLKGLDKKVWIGVGIGAAVVIILVVALVIGLGNKKPTGGNTGNSQNGTHVGTQTGTENGNGATEVIGTEIETEMGTETEITETESESQTPNSSQTQGTGGTTVTQPDDVNGVEQNPITTKPDGEEIIGLGSKDEPYMEFPDADTMTLTTVSVPAGKSLYYGIYRVGGMYLTINDPDAYVVYNKKRYDATNGVISIKLKNVLASQAVTLEIGNKGTSAKEFTLKFSHPEGSWSNPTKVTSILNQSTYEINLAAGNEIGHYYEYKAEKSGTIRFYMTATNDSGLDVQNSNISGGTDQISFDEEKLVKVDEQGRKYIEMAVTQGDVLKIHVAAKANDSFAYPATTITWEAKYS